MSSQLQEMRGIWQAALEQVGPGVVLGGWISRLPEGAAVLCWGKAAAATWKRIRAARPRSRFEALVVSPERRPKGVRGRGSHWFKGEHPLPGKGSLEAGKAVVAFLAGVRSRDDSLCVFLSGGASSLAWVPKKGCSLARLRRELARLASRPWPIRRLNRARSRLCRLKGGGAGRLLGPAAARCRVVVISDVLPFGVETVGSGPFALKGVPHPVAADNRALVAVFRAAARARGKAVLDCEAARTGRWEAWTVELAAACRRALRAGRPGYVIRGGEPLVELGRGRGRGGRMGQLALALALELEPELRSGEVAILCGSSDGRDGGSGSAGAVASAAHWKRWDRAFGGPAKARGRLRSALRSMSSARVLASAGALIPARATGTNVQDLVALSLAPAKKNPRFQRRNRGSS